jgi:hypothetical protein
MPLPPAPPPPPDDTESLRGLVVWLVRMLMWMVAHGRVWAEQMAAAAALRGAEPRPERVRSETPVDGAGRETRDRRDPVWPPRNWWRPQEEPEEWPEPGMDQPAGMQGCDLPGSGEAGMAPARLPRLGGGIVAGGEAGPAQPAALEDSATPGRTGCSPRLAVRHKRVRAGRGPLRERPRIRGRPARAAVVGFFDARRVLSSRARFVTVSY